MTRLQYWDRFAARYHHDVISPFAPEVSFRLSKDLSSIVHAWERDGSIQRRVAIDFGCGVGDGLRLIAGRFPLAAGIDYSNAMLEQSHRMLQRENHVVQCLRRNGLSILASAIKNVKKRKVAQCRTFLVRGNLEQLGSLARSTDICLAINSLISPTWTRNDRMFREVARSVARDGRLFLVLPAFDAMEYLFRLLQRYNINSSAEGYLMHPQGIFVDPSGLKQKYYTPDEILALLNNYRLQVVRMEKILYPWSFIRRFGWHYLPRHRRLWDWYVIARRKK